MPVCCVNVSVNVVCVHDSDIVAAYIYYYIYRGLKYTAELFFTQNSPL